MKESVQTQYTKANDISILTKKVIADKKERRKLEQEGRLDEMDPQEIEQQKDLERRLARFLHFFEMP